MKIKLRNRLDVLMKDSGVDSFEEMSQRLKEHQKFETTRTSISRKFRDDDVTLSLRMVEAICNELQCLPGDLFETEVTDASEEFLEDLRSRLQPFRYGVIRMKKVTGEGAPARETTEAPPTARSPNQTSRRTSKVAPASDADDDDVAGPRVTHLNAAKLKRKD